MSKFRNAPKLWQNLKFENSTRTMTNCENLHTQILLVFKSIDLHLKKLIWDTSGRGYFLVGLYFQSLGGGYYNSGL